MALYSLGRGRESLSLFFVNIPISYILLSHFMESKERECNSYATEDSKNEAQYKTPGPIEFGKTDLRSKYDACPSNKSADSAYDQFFG